MSKINTGFLTSITKFGSRLYKLLFIISIPTLGVWYLNEALIKPEKSKNEEFIIEKVKEKTDEFTIKKANANNTKDSQCKTPSSFWCGFLPFSALIELVSSSIITSVITIVVLEIALKKQLLEEVRGIFKTTEAVKHLSKVHVDLASQKEAIRKALKNLTGGEKIRMLCSSDMIDVFHTEIKASFFIEKLKKNCTFEILTLDPNSNILPIANSQVTDTERIQKSKMIKNFHVFDELVNSVGSEVSTKDLHGLLIVKTFTDLHSTCSYFSIESRDTSKNIHLVSTAFLSGNKIDFVYPAVEILDKDLIKSVSKHFEIFWERSKMEYKVGGEGFSHSSRRFTG